MSGTNFAALRKDALTVLEGEYGVVVKEASCVRNAKGNPMLKVKLTVEQGPYAGRIVYTNMSFTPDSPTAQKILFGQFEILGLGERFFEGLSRATNLDENAQWEVIARELVGRRASVLIGPREWQGQKREEVQSWRAPVGQPNRDAIFSPGVGGTQAAPVGATATSGAPTASALPAATAAATLPPAVPAQKVSAPPTDVLADPFVMESTVHVAAPDEVELPF